MRLQIIVASLLLCSAAFADPVISSITPNTGPVAGGTTVIIKGSGFSDMCIVCSPPFGSPPEVKFMETPAPSVKLIDPETLEVVTPPHFPVTVPVTVRQFDGSQPVTLSNAFTYFGDPEHSVRSHPLPDLHPAGAGRLRLRVPHHRADLERRPGNGGHALRNRYLVLPLQPDRLSTLPVPPAAKRR